MFENKTYETLLEEALELIPEDVDKQEGSIIRTAISPCIYKLAEAYVELDNFLDLVSGDTATGEYLDRVVADYGLIRKQPTYAIRKMITSSPVSIGTRWSLKETTYIVKSILSTNVYKVMCEQSGEVGNIYIGELEALDNVGDVTATLTDIITAGEEKETDNNLRTRFYVQVQAPITSGNSDNYVKWALEVPGVGKAKVFPLWNGAGTVKVLIVDGSMSINEALETTVAAYIETVRPIGATVTIDSPTSLTVNATANIVLDGSKTLEDVKTAFEAELSAYLKEIVFETYSVSYAKVGSILLDIDGVEDHNSLLVNNGTSSITLASTEMPICGTVTLTEVV